MDHEKMVKVNESLGKELNDLKIDRDALLNKHKLEIEALKSKFDKV